MASQNILSQHFFYMLAELKMHLLPVANCEWRAFDIMRGSVQCRVHVQACCRYSYPLNAVGLFLLLYIRCPVLVLKCILTCSLLCCHYGEK